MSHEIDVLVLGGAGVDTIVHVPELPLPYADSYMINPGIVTRAGQTGDFVALGISALGLRSHHLDLVGDDPEGELVRAFHRDWGIPLTAVASARGTKRAVNLVGPDGRRLSLYDATRAEDSDRLPDATVRALAAASRHAHVAITRPCALALPALRESGITVSTDLHNWDRVDPYHERFALAADLVFLSTAALTDPERTMRDITTRAGPDRRRHRRRRGRIPAGRRGIDARARGHPVSPCGGHQRRRRRLRRRLPARLARRRGPAPMRRVRRSGRRLRVHRARYTCRRRQP